MSYILDALKKAEQQRDIGQVPGIGSEHQGPMATGAGRWLPILLAVLLINAGLLVYALWPHQAPPRAAPPQRSAEPLAAQPPLERPPAQAASSPAPAEAVVAPPAALPPLESLRPLPPVSEPSRPVEVESPTGANGSVYPRRGTVVQEPAPLVARDNNLPVWPQVSDQLFRQINSDLRIDVHVYSERAQERFVLINLHKYKKGERLQEGPVVDEITPEGVILSFHGQRFRVLAQ